MSRFFDLDSPLMHALSALMDWFVVSFFTLLCAELEAIDGLLLEVESVESAPDVSPS